MGRSFFKTCAVHSCFSQELFEPKPKRCKCRKFVSQKKATEMVLVGEADWLIDYNGPEPKPTWHLVLRGRTKKTPRSQTIEPAHVKGKTYIYRELFGSDKIEDIMVAAIDQSKNRSIDYWDQYKDIEVEERLKLFHKIGPELVAAKKFSDEQGMLKGAAGKVLAQKIAKDADTLKTLSAINDPFYGHSIFMPIGNKDERSSFGRIVKPEEIRLDKKWKSW